MDCPGQGKKKPTNAGHRGCGNLVVEIGAIVKTTKPSQPCRTLENGAGAAASQLSLGERGLSS